ncbi:hypothetical protein NPJ88_000065 [Halomonas elongata]|uniref:hypothetical protein n=1 Tax=Halomonas elongata TaxID=2746 RepID=UPI00255A7B16|nr:hypothetical protein [Halomonas elongata]MDL4860716.1 hypothetical protein [Halomonas elongata]
MTGRSYTHRVNTGGNFCGHTPANPRIALTEPVKQGKGGLPGVITEAMKRCVDYYKSPWKIPSLNLANGSSRQQRSERREACLSTLWAILKYTDLVTLKVGVPTPEGGFVNLTVKYLARQTGLKQRRIERALADLQLAGLVGVHSRCEKRPDGSYKGLAAIKNVSKLFFSIFGLQFRLGFERKRAAKRLKKKQQQHAKMSGTKTSAARRNLTARAALDKAGSTIQQLGLGKKNDQRQDDAQSLAMDEEQQRQLNELMFQYKMAHPDWTAEQCREAAGKAIAARRR